LRIVGRVKAWSGYQGLCSTVKNPSPAR